MMPIFTSDYKFSLCYVLYNDHATSGKESLLSLAPRKGSSQINISIQLRSHIGLSGKGPRHGPASEFQVRQVRLRTAQVGVLGAPMRTRKGSGTHWTNSLSGAQSAASHSLVYCCALTCISSVQLTNWILMRLGLGRQAWKSYQTCLFTKSYKWIPLLFAMSSLLDVSQSYFSGGRKCHLSLGTGVNGCLHLRSQLIIRFMLKIYVSYIIWKRKVAVCLIG